jgi:hypothetical protein
MAVPTLVRTGTGQVPRPGRIVGNADGTIPVEGVNNLNSYLQVYADKFNVEGISLGDGTHNSKAGNLDAQLIEVRFTAHSQEKEIDHSLRRVPVGYITAMQTSDGALKATNLGGWSPNSIYLTTSTQATGDSLWQIILF